MKALIFAAGLGTRLKPLTDSMPKALVPVCGKPLLYHVMSKLREAGYHEQVINIHHFPQLIRDYLSTQPLDVEVKISDESARLLETGGGILHARDLILPCDEPFLVHNVDIISNLDLRYLREHTRPDALATLVVSDRPTRRNLLFSEDMRLQGWMDRQSGEVRSPIPGLDPSRCRHYAFAGIHNLSPRFFALCQREGFAGRFPIMDFYLSICAKEAVYGLVAENLQLVDVGKFETLDLAEQTCKKILSL